MRIRPDSGPRLRYRMTETLPKADVAILGLGAAGGIAAHVLTEAGLEVAGLEAGPRLTRDDFALDEIGNNVRAALSQPKAIDEVPTWRNSPSETAAPSPWPILMANAVGGTTLHYEALSIRFHPWNFRSFTQTLERYGSGAIPTGSTMADWPFEYEDLEPYYDLVERHIGVSGTAGRIRDELPDPAGNFFEGVRSHDFPMPALRQTGWGELLEEAASRLGWHPFPSPAAINSVPYDGRPACTYCGFCQYNAGCYRDAKGCTNLNAIARAEETGLLRVEPWARGVAIEVDDEGLARGIRFVRDGREYLQPASAVLIGTFTYENTRLLLLSRSKPYPNGLSNNHGQVGKHFIAHVAPFTFGRFPGRRLNLFNGVGSQVTCVDDWNGDNFDHSGLDFVGGGMIAAMHELAPIEFAGGPLPPGVPRWGSEWKSWLASNAQSVGPVFGQLDALPYESNYLDLDPSSRDPLGLPVVRVTHDLGENERRGYDFLRHAMQRWLLEAGAEETWEFPMPIIEGRHSYGGTRMGDDPETSVVDRYGMSHETPNLGVLGASTFPSAGGGNPTLTVQATAWRTAQRVADAWDAIARRL